ncbi:MAG: hypothetical protein A2X64_05620 [Ignavibacteria bacterium GWF2_33_9]|nr:MAG: hypothetical protein A2X64_05620 [Ignavibacteria bacterium GWF2_33_9]
MKKLIILILAVIITACGESNKQTQTEFQIISEVPNESLSKDVVKIRLNNKVEEIELKDIAENLRSERKQYDRLWITYYLPNMDENDIAWATSHFTPELKIEILGSTSNEDLNSTKNIQVDGEIKGKWKSEQIMPGVTLILVLEKNGELILKSVFKDGSSSDKKLTQTTENKKNRYNFDNTFGEYYILEDNGNLGFYGKNGKFGEAEMVD